MSRKESKMRVDAKSESYYKAIVRGKEFLFSDMRIDRKTVPEGIFLYEVREADEYSGEAAEISESILVNFYGSLLTNEAITEWDDEFNGRHFIYLKYSEDPEFFETDEGISEIETEDSSPHCCPLESEWILDGSASIALADYFK